MQEYLRQLKIYIKDIAKLALPITTAFVAMGLMGIIDTMIVGNYNTDQLAYIGLANSIFVVLFTIPIGLLQGVLIKSSQKFGAHKFQSTGKIYNEGRKYSFILAIVFTLLGIQGETILRLLGQDDDMVKHGGEVLRVFVFSIPFILMYVNANFFLQSIRRPYVGMYGIIAANILNIIVNPVLVYGKFGFPELGAVGSATSTLIVRCLYPPNEKESQTEQTFRPRPQLQHLVERQPAYPQNRLRHCHYDHCHQRLFFHRQHFCRMDGTAHDGDFRYYD